MKKKMNTKKIKNLVSKCLGVSLFVLTGFSLGCSSSAPTTQSSDIIKETIHYQSDGLNITAYVYRPNGSGPYPAIVWNHGSEDNPATNENYDATAEPFVKAGYVFLGTQRRGTGDSEGEFMQDTIDAANPQSGEEVGNLTVQLMEGPQLNDQLNGLAWLKSQSYVDQNRIAAMGCSYGGIQTLLGTANDTSGYKVAVAISPAAKSWNNLPIRQMALDTVSGINVPTFLIHPAQDASLEPGPALAQEFEDQGKPYQLKIYPTTGPEQEQQHCFGGPVGNHVWTPDVIQYLQENMH